MNFRKLTNFYLYESGNALPKDTEFSMKFGFKKSKSF